MTDQRPVCPECEQGKHANCDGLAWDHEHDRVTSCECDDRRCAGD